VEQIVISPFDEESDQESINGTPVKKIVKLAATETAANINAKPSKVILKKKDTSDADSFVTSSTPDVDVTEPKAVSNLGIKTLEEIQREKAIRSMMSAKPAESCSKSDISKLSADIVVKSGPQQLSTRRVVISSDQSSLPTASAVTTSGSVVTTVNPRSAARERLGRCDGSLGRQDDPMVTREKPKVDGWPMRMQRNSSAKDSAKESSQSIKPDTDARDRLKKASPAKLKVTHTSAKHRLGHRDNDSDIAGPVAQDEDTDVSEEQKNLSPIRSSTQPSTRDYRNVSSGEGILSKIIVKSLDEIKKEKRRAVMTSGRNDDNGETRPNTETKPSVVTQRIRRLSAERYKPMAKSTSIRSGSEVTQLPTEDSVGKAESPKKATNWLGVKSFAEIMREKQTKRAASQTDVDDAPTSKATQRPTRPRPVPGCSGNTERLLTQPAVSEDSSKAAATSKRKFTPIVFDLDHRVNKKLNTAVDSMSVHAQVKPVTEEFSRPTGTPDPTASPKTSAPTPVISAPSTEETDRNPLPPDVSASQPQAAEKSVKMEELQGVSTGFELKKPCGMESSQHKGPPTLKRQRSLMQEMPDAVSAAKRRLSSDKSRLSMSKPKDTASISKPANMTEYDDDLFTDQLDDLIGDIDDVTDSKSVPNDEALLLEMQELLS
jgi:hypothetical protein